jgi:hypothetical protein
LIGWLGVVLTGSDARRTCCLVGFRKISAEQLGLSPVLMASANSSGGVMGKMIDAMLRPKDCFYRAINRDGDGQVLLACRWPARR